jgi:undecaprenyl-diphosphatase
MPSVPLLFDVTLHVATLIVVLFYYRDIVWKIIVALLHFVQKKSSDEDRIYSRLFIILIVATLFTVAMVLLFSLLSFKTDNIFFIACSMLCTAAILLYRPRKKNKESLEDLRFSHALITGIAQGFGTLPGISRSGITISASLFSGLKREDAGKFAFLLSIPAILGALVLTSLEYSSASVPLSFNVVLGGSLAAIFTGFFSLKMLLWIVKEARLWFFSIYLTLLSIFVFITM